MKRQYAVVLAAAVILSLLTSAAAYGVGKYCLAYWRELGAYENQAPPAGAFGNHSAYVHVWNENGTPRANVPIYTSWGVYLGSTDANGFVEVTLYRPNGYDFQVRDGSHLTDTSPVFNQERGPNWGHYSYEIGFMFKADSNNPGTFDTTYDGILNASGDQPCEDLSAPRTRSLAYYSTVPTDYCSDQYWLGNWSDSFGQTFVANGNRVIACKADCTIGGGGHLVWNAQILQGGPTGQPVGPVASSREMVSDEYAPVLVKWGINDVPVTPGQTYYLKVWRDGGMNVWHVGNNYASGQYYENTTPYSGQDLMGMVLCCTTATTTGTIAGNVKNSSGQNLSGAVVTTNTGGYSATTDANGNYTMTNVAAGTYDVTASKTGYNSSTQTGKTVIADQTTTVNFTLTCTAPSITTQPQSQTKSVGESCTFTVAASGTPPLSYQWRKNGTNISGATSSSYTISSVQTSDAGNYDCVVTNTCGSAASNVAVLTVNPSDTIASENFETMPSWSSSFDATWGSAATWSIVAGGQSGNCLQASRTSGGSSAKVLQYTVPAYTSVTVSVYMKCPSYAGGTYWVETAYKLGSYSAQDYDANSGTWTLIQKFSNSGYPNGNGNVWVQYSATVNTGSNTMISIGYKHGASGCVGPTAGWDTFRITGACTAPTITTQPQSQTKCAGQSVTFTVAASGTTPLSYQWRKNSSNISGATSSSYTIGSVATGDAGLYDCVVTNACGSATSSAATLTVNTAPTITTQPQSQTKCVGQSVTFTVVASGSSLSYQWKKNGTDISGATSSSYTISSVTTADAANYTCYVSNSCGNVTSNAATLTVNTPPTITTHPQSQTKTVGQSVTFTVAASGSTPLSYQWRKNGSNITGATSSSYTIASVQTSDAGNYDCVVTNSCGSATSNVAVLTVTGGTIVAEDFTSMPSWSSSYDAPWGSAATWSIVSGGQSGNFLQAARSSQGSSSKVKVYTVPANTNITISVYMKCPSFGGTYWMESAYRLGSYTAQNFDESAGSWTLIKKFSNSGYPNGNGNTWTNYSVSVNTGAYTQISIGYKLGSSGGAGPTVGWDTFRIQ